MRPPHGKMNLKPALRTGLITSVFVIFAILIGLYGVLETLTLKGALLTMLGATASEVAAQQPTLTNPPLSRVLMTLLAVWVGAVASRGARSWVETLSYASVASATWGGVLALFTLVLNALFEAGVDVSFVFEKLNPQLVTSLSFGLPPTLGAILRIISTTLLGLAGAVIYVGWRALRASSPKKKQSRPARVSSGQLQQAIVVVLLLFLLIAPLQLGIYWNQVLGSIGLYVLLGLGLNIVVGFAGLLDLGYVGFYAIGAYTMAVFTSPDYHFGWSFWLALPLAMILAALAGILLGLPVLPLRGDYLAIVTLGFGEIIRIIFKFNPYTGGPQGILNVGVPTIPTPFSALPPIKFETSTPFFYLILAACVLVAFVAARLNASRTGRAWDAMREDEDAASAMGIDVTRSKLLAFGLGALFAGLGGAIYASRQHAIFPDDFTLLVSINALALIIIGGLGSIPGVIIGSVVLVGVPEVLRPIADFRLLAYSSLLIIMMLVRPEGLIPSRRRKAEIHEQAEDAEAFTVPAPAPSE